ncbi:MAG: HD domain-containing protein [Desulfobacterales bacterium]|nr:HD domain-containing protein [Desulfobacterales bacterium]
MGNNPPEQGLKYIRERAREIVFRSPHPDFYKDFSWAKNLSGEFFETDPVIVQLREYVAEKLEDDFGHGLKHATKVTLDAGALLIIELCDFEAHPFEQEPEKGRRAGYSDRNFNLDELALMQGIKELNRRIMIVQCAGLLHDIKRKEKYHAAAGASSAREILNDYPLSADEVEEVCLAIRNHEAFTNTVEIDTHEGILISDCLYDADKFRWGPDNFSDTIWDMVAFFKTPLSKFMEYYPKGMEKLADIKHTFRSDTGKKYGPQFIDIGLAIGDELYKIIKTEFAHLL